MSGRRQVYRRSTRPDECVLNARQGEQHARHDQRRAEQRQRPDLLPEHQKPQPHRNHEAELVNRRDPGDRPAFQSREVAKPGKPGRNAREDQEQPGLSGDGSTPLAIHPGR